MGTGMIVFRPTFFLLIVSQIPYSFLTKNLEGTYFGNMVFWITLMLGFPVLELCYGFFVIYNV
jgi:hypothetical protein